MMSRSILIHAAVAICCGATWTAHPAWAQPPAEAPVTPLEELMDVEVESVYGASKQEQRLADAPASVTVLTAEDITAFGWRTFADVLSAVRGFYVTYDRNYSYVGVRGFGRPSDYNNRVLLLVDGHVLNDNVYDSAWLGTEFPLSLDVIERIEVIRGPGAALYGTSAFFAVINVVTMRGGGVAGSTASVELASHDLLRSTLTFGRAAADRDILVALSHDRTDGNATLFFPEYADTPSGGYSFDNDEDRATRLFANLRFGATELQGGFGHRHKAIPTGSWSARFNDPRNHTTDRRAWVRAARSFAIGPATLRASVAYDHFAYTGTWAYDESTNTYRDFGLGHWLTGETTYSRRLGRHRILAGLEHRQHLAQNQWAFYHDYPGDRVVDDARTAWQAAGYLQDEITLHPVLTAVLGARYDYGSLTAERSSLVPRIGAVYQPGPDTSIKALYGESFRSPNVYEMFYFETVLAANPALRPETLHTTELVVDQYISPRVRVSGSVYRTRIDDLISQVAIAEDRLQHQNAEAVTATGAGAEAQVRLVSGVLVRGAYSYNDVRDVARDTWLSNSPRHLALFGAAIPFAARRATAAAEASYTGARLSSTGRRLDSGWLMNINMVTAPIRSRLRVSLGVRNLLNTVVEHPIGLEFLQDAMPQDGRTVSLKALVSF